jgi:ABC-2 type transport system ATP-binding protein
MYHTNSSYYDYIKLKDISKKYGDKYAVKKLNLNVESGEVFGFLGPNGAGKTTTIKIITGLMKPDAGEIEIFNQKIKLNDFKFKSKIGFLDSDINLPESESLNSVLKLISNLTPPNHKYLAKLISKLGVDEQTNVPLLSLSRGTRQKMAIILSMAHNPDLLILDEPTEGLDPLAQEIFYKLILERKSLGKTTFFSSHNLNEVQKVCTKVAFIKDSELIDTQPIRGSALGIGGKIFVLSLKQNIEKANLIKLKSAGAKQIEFIAGARRISFLVDSDLKKIISLISDLNIDDIEIKDQNLEQAFLKLYEKPSEGEVL